MGFWNKLGKIALTAAPYIAAPFTGGMSLAATGLANKAVQKWSESDAQKAVAKGLAPSNFDAVLGKVGNIASTASMFMPAGALGGIGKAASTAGKVGSGLSKTQGALNLLSNFTGGSYKGPSNQTSSTKPGQSTMVNQKSPYGTLPVNARSSNQIAFGSGGTSKSTDLFNSALARGTQGRGGAQDNVGQNSSTQEKKNGGFDWKAALGLAIPAVGGLLASGVGRGEGGDFSSATPIRQQPDYSGRIKNSRGLGPSMSMQDQSNPNLALSIAEGRQQAMQNQPWRRGYDTNFIGYNEDNTEEVPMTTRMPRIYSTGQQQRGRARRAAGY